MCTARGSRPVRGENQSGEGGTEKGGPARAWCRTGASLRLPGRLVVAALASAAAATAAVRVARLKKQEEKRQRRFNKKNEGETPEGQVEGTTAESGMEAGDHPAESAQDDSPPAGQTVTEAPEGEKGAGTPA